MSAKDYPVTQGYGYDPTYPTPDHFHKGIDYGCPMQTPVIVNGVQIGLSGNTGFVTGPHLHVGRWIGGQHTNPGVGNGFNFGDAVVTEISEDATNGKYVRVQGDGASWVYLHLFEQTCHVGQRLTEAVPQKPAPASTGSHVTLPAHVASWAVYRVGSGLRKGTSDQVGTLLPSKFGGLTYAIKSWVGDYAVIIDTQSFGEVTVWVKGTEAEFNNGNPDVPAPVAPPPAPAPAPAVSQLPAAPLSAPSSETYDLVKELDGYVTATQAINHVNPKVRIPKDTYFVFNKRFENNDPKAKLLAVNLTKTAGTPGAWIAVADNILQPVEEPKPVEEVAEPAPEPEPVVDAEPAFADTYKHFPQPQLYVAMRNLDVVDQADVHKAALMPQYSVTWITGSFVKDGVEYARPESATEKNWWHGIPWVDRDTNVANLELEREVFKTKTTLAERQATHTLKPFDHIQLATVHVKKFALDFIAFFGRIKAGKTK